MHASPWNQPTTPHGAGWTPDAGWGQIFHSCHGICPLRHLWNSALGLWRWRTCQEPIVCPWDPKPGQIGGRHSVCDSLFDGNVLSRFLLSLFLFLSLAVHHNSKFDFATAESCTHTGDICPAACWAVAHPCGFAVAHAQQTFPQHLCSDTSNKHTRIFDLKILQALRYGNYCGPGPQGVCTEEGECHALPGRPPVDEIDESCLVHDISYDSECRLRTRATTSLSQCRA